MPEPVSGSTPEDEGPHVVRHLLHLFADQRTVDIAVPHRMVRQHPVECAPGRRGALDGLRGAHGIEARSRCRYHDTKPSTWFSVGEYGPPS